MDKMLNILNKDGIRRVLCRAILEFQEKEKLVNTDADFI